MEPSAKIVLDSISPEGIRVTSIEAVIHRFVLAETNTHRVFSRNSASSRAIPLHKQISRVLGDMAVPVVWPAEKPGMSGGEPIPEEDEKYAFSAWEQARDAAVSRAQRLGDIGVHKSVANRLLEPFMYHTVLITSTAWKNFFRLRVNPGAQPEFRVAADAMRKAYRESTPKLLNPGQWHMPYIRPEDYDSVRSGWDLIKISAARCARVSYLTQGGIRDPEEDIKLYNKLTSADPMHASPLEHVCTPHAENMQEVRIQRHFMMDGTHKGSMTLILPKYGNFLGWHQHRFDVEILKGYRAFS